MTRSVLPFVIALSFTRVSQLSGQQDRPASPRVLTWVTIGAGGATAGNGGFAGAAGFDVLSGNQLVSLRATGVALLFDDDLWDVGLLYGRAVRRSHGLAAGSAGLAIMGGDRCVGFLGGSCTRMPVRLSLPLAARIEWNAAWIGVGVYAFGNLNSGRSFAGAALTIQLGRLR